jgi:VWFA-related protein
MRKKLLILFALLLPLIFVYGSFAQGQSTLNIGAINDEAFPQLEVLVNVQDSNGIPLTNLTAADFSVLLDGQPVPVVSVENITNNELPISVVMVIDTSDSMAGTPLADTKTAALSFLEQLRDGDEIAVIDFDSQVKLAQDYTSDLDAVRQTINGLESSGKTALYDAFFTAAEVAARANTPRRFIVFLTDGNEYGGLSTHGAFDGAELAKANAIPFYNIGLGFGVVEQYLSDVAHSTGGDYFIYPGSDQLKGAYEYLGSYLRTQYILTIAPVMEPDGATHELTVSAAGGSVTEQYTAIDLYPQITVTGLPEGGISETTVATVSVNFPRGRSAAGVASSVGSIEFVGDPVLGDNSYEQQVVIEPFNFAPGDYTFSIDATDSAGGTRTLEVPFTIAPIPPIFSVVGLSDGAVVRKPTMTFGVHPVRSQQPIQSVSFSVDGLEISTLTAEPYQFALDALAVSEGTHTATIVVTDAAGTANAKSLEFGFRQIFYAAPDFAIVGLADGEEVSTAQIALSVLMDAEAPFPPQSATISLDGQEVATLTAEPYNYTIDTLSLSPGGHSLEVSVLGGNGVTGSETVNFSINSALFDPPSFTISGLTPGELVNQQEVEIAVEVAESPLPPQSVTISLDGQEAAALTTEPFEHTIDITALGAGDHTLEVNVLGGNGQTASQSVDFQVDPNLFAGPEFAIVGLADGDVLNQPEVTVSILLGEGEAAPQSVTIGVDGTEAAAFSEEPFEHTLDLIALGEGEHTLDVTVVGADGHESTESVTFSVDPALFITPEPTEVSELPTATPEPSDTPEPPTDTPEPSDTPEPTEVSELPTATPEPSDTPEPPTDTPEPATDTPEPTEVTTEEPTEEVAQAITEEPTEVPTEEATEEPTEEPTEVEPTPTQAGETVDVPVPSTDEGEEDNSLLPIIGGAIIILLVLIALYFFFGRRSTERR